MPKHTPGPWSQSHRRQPGGSWSTQVYDEAGGNVIATIAWYPVDLGNGSVETAREANARLIAAAPDLLDALEIAEGFMAGFEGDECQETVDDDLVIVRAAIAKAKGE